MCKKKVVLSPSQESRKQPVSRVHLIQQRCVYQRYMVYQVLLLGLILERKILRVIMAKIYWSFLRVTSTVKIKEIRLSKA